MNRIKLIVGLVLLVNLVMGCEQEQKYQSKAVEIFPPHELFTVALFRMNNLNLSPAYFKDHWTTILLGHAPCDEQCLSNLNYLDEVITGQKLFVFDNIASTQHIKELTDQFKSVSITMGVTATSSDFFLAHFNIEGIEQRNRNQYFYLVNPDGAIAYSLLFDNLKADDIDNELSMLISDF